MTKKEAKELISEEYVRNGWTVTNNHQYDLIAQKGDDILYLLIRYSKLYTPTPDWESRLFHVTSWSMFDTNAYNKVNDSNARVLILLYSEEKVKEHYSGDIFSFPVNLFRKLINDSPNSRGKRKFCISKSKHSDHWYVWKSGIGQYTNNLKSFCTGITSCWRNFT